MNSVRLGYVVGYLSLVLLTGFFPALATATTSVGSFSNEAIEAYRKAIELNPKLVTGITDPALSKAIGSSFLDDGKQLLAAGDLVGSEHSLMLAGNFLETFDLYSSLGECYQRQEAWKRSILLFRKALKIRPSDALNRARMAVSYLKLGKKETAVKLFCEALVRDKNQAVLIVDDETRKRVVDQLVKKARALSRRGKFMTAAKHLKVATILNPSPDLFFEIGSIYSDEGKTREAARAFGLAVEQKSSMISKLRLPSLRKQTARDLFERGVGHYKKEEFEKAAKLFRLSMKLDAKGATAYNLADCSVRLKDVDSAVSLYKKAIELEPKLSNAYVNLAVVYLERKQPAKAVEMLRELINRSPGDGPAYEMLARAFLDQKKNREAAGVYRTAVEYDTGMSRFLKDKGLRDRASESLYESAVAQFKQKRYQEALNDIECAQALKPKAKYLFVAGNAHYALGHDDQALKAYRTASKELPTRPNIVNNIGNILLKKGRYNEAIEMFRRAAEIDPQYAQAYNNLGIALRKKGLVKEAIAAYRKALELKPDYAAAYYNLGNALTGINVKAN